MASQSNPAKENDSPRKNITFGVELEFALLAVREHVPDPEPTDSRSVHGMLEQEGDDPSPRVAQSEQMQENLNKHLVQTITREIGLPVSIQDDMEPIPLHILQDHWLIYEDSTVEATHEIDVLYGKDHIFAIEIKSPPLYFTEAALKEVKKVVETIRNNYRVTTNATCGYHVHVGLGSRGFPLRTVQNLLAIYWTFEPQLDQLRPRHRVSGSRDYCGSIWGASNLSWKLRTTDQPFRHGITAIYNAGCISDLQWLFNLRAALWIGNLGTSENKETIEFRIHEGTMDPKEIEVWIRVCVQLVNVADTVDQKHFDEFIAEQWNAPRGAEISVKNFLTNMGCVYAAEYYSKRDLTKLQPYENGDS